jgi:hypothetical protein
MFGCNFYWWFTVLARLVGIDCLWLVLLQDWVMPKMAWRCGRWVQAPAGWLGGSVRSRPDELSATMLVIVGSFAECQTLHLR